MRKIIYTILITSSCYLQAQQLFVGRTARIHISEGATLEVGGDLENTGVIENFGTLALYGDWTINNNFNGDEGSISFLGGGGQSISPGELTLSELIVNTDGVVTFPGDEYTITDRIDFRFGVVQVGNNTRFILGESARVLGGSNDSYFDGPIIHRGGGTKVFPVGSNGIYAPLTLVDIFGANSEISASFSSEHSIDPIPGENLLGVSHRGLWELQLESGFVRGSQIELEFNQEDLSDFRNFNNIRNLVNTPIVAFTNNVTEPWGSLGVAQLLDTDSLTFGTITSRQQLTPTFFKTFLAVGLAPEIPEEGLFFIPSAFSPNASDPDNKTFKVFGEKIVDEDFFLRIFNRFGSIVYETTSFMEANETGWNGINLSGGEEPVGIYYYEYRLKFQNGNIEEGTDTFYLVK